MTAQGRPVTAAARPARAAGQEVPYDLLLKGGRVLDPGQGLDAKLDTAVAGGKIAQIAADIPAAQAVRVLELRGQGRRVVPGLIDADLSIIDVVEGDFTFTDTNGLAFRGRHGLVPVRTIKAGEEFAPGWGTHPWGWLPASAPVE